MNALRETVDLEFNVPPDQGDEGGGPGPYRILLVGDFSGGASGSIHGPLSEGPVSVTADTFDSVLRDAAPRIQFLISDPVAAGNRAVEIELTLESLRSLDPDALIDQLPACRPLFQARKSLVDRLQGRTTGAQLNRTVKGLAGGDDSLAWLTESLQWKPQPSAPGQDTVDRLLDQIDLGEGTRPPDARAPSGSPIRDVVSSVARSGTEIPADEASALRKTMAELDRRLSAWLNAVLHSEPVQSLETAWRSVAFVVSQMDFRKGLRLSLLHAPREHPLPTFRQRVIDPVFDAGADAPHLVVIDRLFGQTAPDIETIDEFAQHAASLPAVVFAGAGPAFFGVKHAWQVPTLPPFVNLFDQWQFAKWKSFRGEPYARSLGLFFGRGLLRTAYERMNPDESAFLFRESCGGERDLIWCGGAVVAAAAVARSVADTGWPCAMAGMVHGRVSGFSTARGGPKGDKEFGPADTVVAQQRIEEMAVTGVNATLSLRDLPDLLVWNGLSAARPERIEPSAFLQISLPYQLFVARLSALLFDLKPLLAAATVSEIPQIVTRQVSTWIPVAEPAPQEWINAQVRVPENRPEGLELAVTVTPPTTILPGGIPVVMGFPIR